MDADRAPENPERKEMTPDELRKVYENARREGMLKGIWKTQNIEYALLAVARYVAQAQRERDQLLVSRHPPFEGPLDWPLVTDA